MYETVERICVLRALKLGDLVCATPALRALRGRYPHAQITLIGLPWAQDFAARLAGWVDDFEVFPGHPDLPERRGTMDEFCDWVQQMRERHFDLALQLHGSGELSNGIVRALGAKRTVGFHAGAGIVTAADGNESFWPYPDGLHEIHRNLALIQHLGGDVRDDQPAFPLLPADFAELQRHPDLAALTPGTFICLHPGARMANKRWAPEHFAAVGDTLANNGWRVVLTGDASEHELAAAVQAKMRTPALNAARDLSVGALAALLSRSRLLVSNDTGVAHIAAALQLPSVVIFFATDPKRWAPLDRLRHRCVIREGGDAASVTPSEVVEAAWPLLALPWALRVRPDDDAQDQDESPAAWHQAAAALRRAAAPAR
ncbi:glycosyltransferase family 9 protein [Caldimonas brevitalea]|uniref:glycosyltransferase family 9 protein n=1 Tax=Caldimonas brevitalea TaxID=413882 RepID=UPI00069C6BDC|nr:glycosyltransferase family 9 protein [Caldimonas brevitalea]